MRVSYEEKGWAVDVLMIDDVWTWSLDDGAAVAELSGRLLFRPSAITTPSMIGLLIILFYITLFQLFLTLD